MKEYLLEVQWRKGDDWTVEFSDDNMESVIAELDSYDDPYAYRIEVKPLEPKVFTSVDFSGHYPVGTAAVVVAFDEASAHDLLAGALDEDGISDTTFSLQELDLSSASAIILNNGDY